MIELTAEQFSQACGLFQTTPYGVLAAGTLEGGHPGRVFVDQPHQPQAALLCTQVGYYFLAGRSDQAAFNTWLPTIFLNTLGPQQLERLQDPELLLFYPHQGWQTVLRQNFTAFDPPIALQKKRLVMPPLPQSSPHEPLPEGFHVRALNAALLNIHPELDDEIKLFYGSGEAFLSRSLGVCILDDQGQIASTCFAVFTGGGEAEISIATAERYRRRGLAFHAATAFIGACRARGLAPVWGCFPENKPSLQLARRLGFQDDCDQDFYLFQQRYGGSPNETPSTNTATA